ncbi:unnamed protein product [Prorocentrum cordatum]|uniref:Uncharacterized protein n=1 Tax=Prorocentrum cordatum TaxID=2364126 RepID=A0ABN9U747_9DINO|nr:unnamed protein product [Polarella glacialis]
MPRDTLLASRVPWVSWVSMVLRWKNMSWHAYGNAGTVCPCSICSIVAAPCCRRPRRAAASPRGVCGGGWRPGWRAGPAFAPPQQQPAGAQDPREEPVRKAGAPSPAREKQQLCVLRTSRLG